MTDKGIDPNLADVKTRGFWDVTIRPTAFEPTRIADVRGLQPLLESMQVRMSGWYFPDIERPVIKGDHLEESVAFEDIVEFFRFYQSGQFVHLSGFREDWQDRAKIFGGSSGREVKPGDKLGIGATISRITHIYEFAARMAQRLPGDDDLWVEIWARGIQNRELAVDSPHRAPLRAPHRAEIPEFPDARQLPRATLLAQPRELAVDFLANLFVQFQWRGEKRLIAGWQSEMFGKQ